MMKKKNKVRIAEKSNIELTRSGILELLTDQAKTKTKKPTTMDKVMRLWPKKKPPKQTFFSEMLSDKSETEDKKN